MEKWSMEELEKLYQEVNEKARSDADFRNEVLADPKAALEKFTGRALPDDIQLQLIQQDSSFRASYVVPDFAAGELSFDELSTDTLEQISSGAVSADRNGFSVFLAVSICPLAGAVGPCGIDACGANACAANVCAGNVCGADACGGNACGGNAGVAGACGGNACGADACGANAGCAGYVSAADTCGANTGCMGYVNHSSSCGANYGCYTNIE